MRKILFLMTLLFIFNAWAFAESLPDDIQALINKEMSNQQLTAEEKSQVEEYWRGIYSGNPWLDTQYGPDGWYVAKDPASGGQAFNWIDISATGTEIWPGQDQDDTWSSAIDLPFTFPYYGTTRDSVKISANVLICFENQTTPSYSLAIPSATGQMKIDPWCYDMYHHGTDTVGASHYYYQAFGDTLFVVQFKQARYFTTTYRYDETYGKDMEVLLYNDGRIVFQYDSLRNIVAGSPYASGIEDSVGTAGLSCGNTFTQGLAITFSRLTGPILANGTVTPATGNLSTTFTYSVLYRNTDGYVPNSATVYIDGIGTFLTDPTGGTGNYFNGVTFTYSTTLTAGPHNYYYEFVCTNGTVRLPETGTLAGPIVYPPFSGSYDIGGGMNDFPSIITAVNAVAGAGMTGPVTFNVYTGTYPGQVVIPSAIAGLSETNPLVLQAAPGQTPRVTNTTGTTLATGSGFRIAGADYVTIRGFEVDSCYYLGIDVYYGATSSDSARFCTIEGNYLHNVGYGVTTGYGIYTYYATNCQIIGNEVQGDYYGIRVYYSKYMAVANNMVYGNDYYGIQNYYGTGNSYYYNSIYMNSNYATTNYVFYGYNSANTTLKNNIFFNGGSGSTTKYAIYLAGAFATYPVVSNYNCLYSPNSSLGYFTAARPTLADWQAATGLDANSVSVDPMFVSVTPGSYDLHIVTNIPSPVNNLGTVIASITTDIDGETRSLETPDIGCDEFTPVIANYNVMMMPVSQSGNGAAGSTLAYLYYVKNVGGTIDTYNLSTFAALWATSIWDSTNTIPIVATNALAPDDSQWVCVRHQIPVGTVAGTSDIGYLMAQSVNSATVSDTSSFTTNTSFSGAYDIGGGANHFATPVLATQALVSAGMSGPTTFNIYPGLYDGQILLPGTIVGLSAGNPLVYQAVPGMAAPQITNSTGTSSTTGNGFSLTGADYVTIRGFEIFNCYYSGIDVYYSGTDSCKYLTIERNYIHDCGTGGSYYGMYLYRMKYSTVSQNIVQGDYYGIYLGYGDGVVLSNNMLYGQDYYGWRIYYGSNIELYYNSVYMNSNYSTTNYATYIYYVTNATLKNNISFNEGSGSTTKYAIYIGGTLATYPVISDYNCWYAPNSSLGYYTAAQTDLTAWQTATLLDSHSVSGNPQYLSTVAPYNLHINTTAGSVASNIATPIATVLIDIDGDLRDALTPDIGADEFIAVIINYGVSVAPEAQTGTGIGGDDIEYYYYVKNTGDVNDIFNLSTSANVWQATIYDSSGTNIITATPSIPSGDSVWVLLVHSIPDTATWGDFDAGNLIATSTGNPAVADAAMFFTTATSWPPVQTELIPDSANIVIPAGGGSFTYTFTVTNFDPVNSYPINISKTVTLPNGTVIPLFTLALNIDPSRTITRNLVQLVPAGAPAGNYIYNTYLVDMTTWEIWDTETVLFTKSGVDGAPKYTANGWSLLGWNENSLSAMIIPTAYDLKPAYPNPFNPVTNIVFDMPNTGHAFLAVYDITGREVARLVDDYYFIGRHTVAFDASNLSSGVYFAVFKSGNFSETQKLLLMK
jgi:parallel beta-helix repeat protein